MEELLGKWGYFFTFDPRDGLIKFYYRTYHPSVGLWIFADTIEPHLVFPASRVEDIYRFGEELGAVKLEEREIEVDGVKHRQVVYWVEGMVEFNRLVLFSLVVSVIGRSAMFEEVKKALLGLSKHFVDRMVTLAVARYKMLEWWVDRVTSPRRFKRVLDVGRAVAELCGLVG